MLVVWCNYIGMCLCCYAGSVGVIISGCACVVMLVVWCNYIGMCLCCYAGSVGVLVLGCACVVMLVVWCNYHGMCLCCYAGAEERSVGKECFSTSRSGWSQYNTKKKYIYYLWNKNYET